MGWKTTREWTDKVLTAMDDGILDPRDVAEMCLHFMSEDDVKDMCQYNDILNGDEDDAE